MATDGIEVAIQAATAEKNTEITTSASFDSTIDTNHTASAVKNDDVHVDTEAVAEENERVDPELDGFDFDVEGDDSLIISSPGMRNNMDTVSCELPLALDADSPQDNDDKDFATSKVDSDLVIDEGTGRSRSRRLLPKTHRELHVGVSRATSYDAPRTRNKKTCTITQDPLMLHSAECWVTVKWEGLPYEDASFEDLADLRSSGLEYESAMRAFYRREQRKPSQANRPRKVKRALDNPVMHSTESPPFPAGELRDYQWEGVRWLLFNWSQRRNSILADEMGLGKTIQSAGFLQLLKRHQNVRGPFLIVAPLSTIVNWQRELEAWTDLDTVLYHGSIDDRKLIREHEFFYMSRGKKDGYKVEVVITTPETCLAADSKTATGRIHRELSQIDWDVLIVDEAHKLKNYSSKFCTTIREEFSYQSCVLLTGTPLQNNTEELWTLLNFVDKNKFSDQEKFLSEYGDLKTSAQLEKIHSLIKPYLLRREKENVEKAVPPKEEVIIEVKMHFLC